MGLGSHGSDRPYGGCTVNALTPATATIDAGRMLTLERRRKFATLELHFTRLGQAPVIIKCADNPAGAGVLSERRIARAAYGVTDTARHAVVAPAIAIVAARIADDVHVAMRNWCNTGYPVDRSGVVKRWHHGSVTVTLVSL